MQWLSERNVWLCQLNKIGMLAERSWALFSGDRIGHHHQYRELRATSAHTYCDAQIYSQYWTCCGRYLFLIWNEIKMKWRRGKPESWERSVGEKGTNGVLLHSKRTDTHMRCEREWRQMRRGSGEERERESTSRPQFLDMFGMCVRTTK